jgi:hypothetical protein
VNCFFVFYEYYATFGYSKAVIEEKESSAINGTQDEVIQQLEMDLFELIEILNLMLNRLN